MTRVVQAIILLFMTVSLTNRADAAAVNIDDLISGAGFIEHGGLRFDQFNRSGEPGSFWVEPITTGTGAPGLRFFGENSESTEPFNDQTTFWYTATSLNSNIFMDGMTGSLNYGLVGGTFDLTATFLDGSTVLGSGTLSNVGSTSATSVFSSAVLTGTVSNAYVTTGPHSSGEISVTQAFTLRLGESGAPLILPTDTPGGTFVFTAVPSGIWYDPETAYGFTYEMTSGSLFTEILNFPSGFANTLSVSVPGCAIPQSGTFGAGSTVNFVTLCGGGVSTFTIAGISPLVDPVNPVAFPLQLAFNTPTASFTMQSLTVPVPEPSALVLLAPALVILIGCRWLLHRRANLVF